MRANGAGTISLVTPAILRRFYEASIDAGPYGAAMRALDVTFEDYFEFLRMNGPLITRRSAAENAQRAEFRKLAEKMPPDPPTPEPPETNAVYFERKPKLALDKVKIDPACQGLHITRVKSVTGWASLARLRSLRHLSADIVDSNDTVVAPRKIRLDTLDVDSTSLECLRSVLSSFDAARVSFGDTPGVMDLRSLPLGRKITHFRAAATLVRGVSALSKSPIEDLCLGYVEIDDELRALLASLAPTLSRLVLTPTKLYHPKELGDLSRLPALRQVLAHTSKEHRAAWIDCAVAHPKVGFSFYAFDPPTGEVCTLEALHRGVDILRFERKGKKPSFEVAGDLASMRKRYRGSNEDLEDELRAEAKRAKKKIAWSSENDMLVGRAADVDTCRWIIDGALGGPTA